MKRTMITMAAVAASALALAACGSAESVGGNASTGSSENGSTTLVVGCRTLLERDHRRAYAGARRRVRSQCQMAGSSASRPRWIMPKRPELRPLDRRVP